MDPSLATVGSADPSPAIVGRVDPSPATNGMIEAGLGQGSDDDGSGGIALLASGVWIRCRRARGRRCLASGRPAAAAGLGFQGGFWFFFLFRFLIFSCVWLKCPHARVGASPARKKSDFHRHIVLDGRKISTQKPLSTARKNRYCTNGSYLHQIRLS